MKFVPLCYTIGSASVCFETPAFRLAIDQERELVKGEVSELIIIPPYRATFFW